MGKKTHERVEHDGKTHDAWMVWCPACKTPHAFDKRWTFNGNHEAPTFRNSMLRQDHAFNETTGKYDGPVKYTCHSYLTDGVWEYLKDCSHEMKSKKVPAPDWDTRHGA
jgi:hypothetical protein